jgi:hypothetical protein
MDDPETHVIVVDADFDGERGFFPLSEYIAWANGELDQSRRWIAKSENTADAGDYTFPWRRIEGHILVEGKRPQPLKFVLDRDRLLNLLIGHTLYNDATVAVRELVQNAIDAVRFQRYLDRRAERGHEEGQVLVQWDEENRQLTVVDNGTGMDQDVIESHLMRVGASFYESDAFKSLQPDFTPISRFGIGILTCFMISDDIEILTIRDGKAFRLRMTSAHADYLLNPLDPESHKVRNLRPHGTRVRLRVRKTVDLERRGIRDILRHWMILPECPVFYNALGKKERIGFESVEAALRSGLPAHTGGGTDVAVSFREEDSQGRAYDLAIGVRESSFVPERSFVTLRDPEPRLGRPTAEDQLALLLPAVCVEGVRVDNRIPGIGGRIAALLSVKGNRSFRTTVARDGLERDEEYDAVAKKSMELFFGHIRSEVDRISRSSGTPLSQASSAVRWLTSSFVQSSHMHGRDAVSKYLESLLSDLPSVVVENIEVGESRIVRRLLSTNQIREMDYFWTLESRAFDYLGIISRDLGREIEIHSFIESIGVDLEGLPLTPLVADASMHASWILNEFETESVSMGLARQYTRIKWRREKEEAKFDRLSHVWDWKTDDTRFLLEVYGDDFRHPRMNVELDRWFDGVMREITTTKVAAFDESIDHAVVVRTIWVTVVNQNKKVGELWSKLADALRRTLTEDPASTGLLTNALVCVSSYCLRGTEDDPNARGLRPSKGGVASWWGANRGRISETLKRLGCGEGVPEHVEELRVGYDEIVDTKAYWRDWTAGG